MASTAIGLAQSQAPVQRQTVANDIMDFSDELANRAGNFVSRMDAKLCAISNPSCPEAGNKCNPVPGYPPYFDGLRDKLQRISSSLDAMEDILSRVEL